jgi:hypothetical protein
MSEENNWYERLLNEKSSLDEKIKKLNHFLGGDKSNTVNPDEVVAIYFCCNSNNTISLSETVVRLGPFRKSFR